MPFTRLCEALPSTLGHGCHWLRETLAPSLSVALVNVTALLFLVFASSVLLLWLQPSPIRSVEVVSVEPADRIVDRAQRQSLVVRRRIVMSRAAELRLMRSWIDEAGAVTPLLDDWAFIPAGDNLRPAVVVVPPASLNPGKHRYRVVLEWCSSLNWKCDRVHPPDVEVLVKGHTPVPDRIDFQDPRF